MCGLWTSEEVPLVDAVEVALIIVYYFNGTDNPKTQSKLDGKSV